MLEIGAQIIALNSQQRDNFMTLLFGYFQENGGAKSGYLLKPEYMRKGVLSTQIQNLTVKVRVISCINIRDLVKYKEFPYCVKMGFYGSIKDSAVQGNDQGVVPVTEIVDSEDAVFRRAVTKVYKVSEPYFASIYFEIDNFGRRAVPVRLAREGYRALRLLDYNCEPIPSSFLLIKTEIIRD